MFDPSTHFLEHESGLLIQHKQEIPTEFLEECADWRKAHSRMTKAQEYHKIAEIPVIFVHKWLQEGFNVYQEPLKATVSKLKAEGLDDFLTTEKQI